MKYLIPLAGLLLTACSPSSENLQLTRYEVTCPINMTLAKVDTVDVFNYYYGSNSLTMFVPPAQPMAKVREYPKTCVMTHLRDWTGGN